MQRVYEADALGTMKIIGKKNAQRGTRVTGVIGILDGNGLLSFKLGYNN